MIRNNEALWLYYFLAMFHVKQNLLLSKKQFHIVFYSINSGDSEVFNQYFSYIWTEKCRECRPQVNIFYPELKQRKEDNHGFLFVP